jgi:hypothetical protein
MAKPKTIDELDPIPMTDPTITQIAKEVEALDKEAKDTITDGPLKEKNGFTLAPSVEKVVRDVIYDESLVDLQGQRILCAHSLKVRKSGGKPVLYEMKLLGGLHSFLNTYVNLTESDEVDSAERFFVLIVPMGPWSEMGSESRKALVYEALCRCGVDEESGRLFIVKPDFEGYYNSIAKHGLWRKDLKQMGEVSKPHITQLQLLETP